MASQNVGSPGSVFSCMHKCYNTFCNGELLGQCPEELKRHFMLWSGLLLYARQLSFTVLGRVSLVSRSFM